MMCINDDEENEDSEDDEGVIIILISFLPSRRCPPSDVNVDLLNRMETILIVTSLTISSHLVIHGINHE